jgi:hypothetical protein
VLNWAAYGLWEDQNKHLLSDKEVADKKKLSKRNSNLLYRSTPKGKASQARSQMKYEASEGGKECLARGKRKSDASEGGKEKRSQYEASEGRKENRRQTNVRATAAGAKRTREFLEETENNKRHAVQQKTNEPSCGVLAYLLGRS